MGFCSFFILQETAYIRRGYNPGMLNIDSFKQKSAESISIFIRSSTYIAVNKRNFPPKYLLKSLGVLKMY